ncbi:hypothetical protein TNCV_4074421 [Trichonephila clavipes]|uniref:Uncharacterized protein n=1 Tax=Trichonephila clavipes TaxID=2585209 RepID=A0A8X6W8H2_TRICX|nr:hypothetical protein TNCV_4074421 [Trichonephila clavipes]
MVDLQWPTNYKTHLENYFTNDLEWKAEFMFSLTDESQIEDRFHNFRVLPELDSKTEYAILNHRPAFLKLWQRGLIGSTAHARVPSQRQSAFTSRREQLESVSSTRERSVDICSRLLPLDERLYLAPSASIPPPHTALSVRGWIGERLLWRPCELLLLRQVWFDGLSVASCVSDGFWLLLRRIDGTTSASRRLHCFKVQQGHQERRFKLGTFCPPNASYTHAYVENDGTGEVIT